MITAMLKDTTPTQPVPVTGMPLDWAPGLYRSRQHPDCMVMVIEPVVLDGSRQAVFMSPRMVSAVANRLYDCYDLMPKGTVIELES